MLSAIYLVHPSKGQSLGLLLAHASMLVYEWLPSGSTIPPIPSQASSPYCIAWASVLKGILLTSQANSVPCGNGQPAGLQKLFHLAP